MPAARVVGATDRLDSSASHTKVSGCAENQTCIMMLAVERFLIRMSLRDEKKHSQNRELVVLNKM